MNSAHRREPLVPALDAAPLSREAGGASGRARREAPHASRPVAQNDDWVELANETLRLIRQLRV
ncbi:hypothetical protein [Thioalkalivibrio sp.]|uniref:hypothetical protein n=1 Tax=Thioalkalivibrio sp. TaxID=2093813 RepID=UPI0039747132